MKQGHLKQHLEHKYLQQQLEQLDCRVVAPKKKKKLFNGVFNVTTGMETLKVATTIEGLGAATRTETTIKVTTDKETFKIATRTQMFKMVTRAEEC